MKKFGTILAILTGLMLWAAGMAQAVCKQHLGHNYVCTSTDVLANTIVTGSRRYDSDTKKQFLKVGSSWVELNGFAEKTVKTVVPGTATGVVGNNWNTGVVMSTDTVSEATANTSASTRMRKTKYVSATDAVNPSYAELFSTGLDTNRAAGFKLKYKFEVTARPAGSFGFFGMSTNSMDITTPVDFTTSPQNAIGLAFGAADTKWSFVSSNGVSVSAIDLGDTFPVTVNDVLTLTLESPVGGGTGVAYTVTNNTTGATVSGKASLTIPAVDEMLVTHFGYMSTGTDPLVAVSFAIGRADLMINE